MPVYPRKYTVDQGELAPILMFDWEFPGYNLWGIKVIAFYLKIKLKAKVVHKMRSTFESQWVLDINGDQVSIYQDDIYGYVRVSVMKGSNPGCMSDLVNLFSTSWLFNQF